MSDYLVKAMAFEGQVRAYATTTTMTIQEAVRRHQTWPTATAALGRAMTAAVMMGAMQKGNVKTTVKVDGGGPIGVILVDSNALGEIRGYVTNPQTDFELNEQGKLDVQRAVGTSGTLSVVKDLGLRDNFTGQVPIISGELAEDFTYYFAHSEQTPSAVALGVLTKPHSVIAAGGYIVQLMPNVDEEVISRIEQAIATALPVSEQMEAGHTPEDFLYHLLGKENVTILESIPVQFKCQCSRERTANILVSLGKQELLEMIDDGKAEVICHFCNEKYHFTKEELQELAELSF